MALANVFNRRRSIPGFIQRGYAALLHRATQYVESAEANEAQDIIFERLASIGDAAFGPVNVKEGGTVVIDVAARTVRISASKVWAGGYMHAVPAATLTNVSMVGTVSIGLAVTVDEIDENEDFDLRGIVPNEASQGEPLAGRLHYDAVWATSGDPFYPVYTIIDGIIPNERATPSNDVAELLVERHVRETHGSHVIDGFNVSPGGFDPASVTQTFIIRAGTLRANGRRVSRTVDQRYPRVEDPDLVQVNGEVQTYPNGGLVTLNNGPISAVQTVTVIKEVTRNITHQLSGGKDNLPDTPVYAIVSITQGGTTYAENTSWVRDGDGISWAPAGPEPSAGSTYTVVYRYIATVTPQSIGRQTIQLESAVVGQPVTVLYSYKLPRIDVIAVDLDGNVVYLKGISSRYNPTPPPVPEPLAPLVRVSNKWGIDPAIEDVDQRKVTEAQVQEVIRTILNMGDLLSLVSLQRDIQERDPASRRGSFVDPFEDDLQRDLGLTQDAAVAGGFVMLPIDGYPIQVKLTADGSPLMLPYVTEPVIRQPFRTLSKKINEYQNFTALPALMRLSPAIDRWNETQRTSSSSSTSSFKQEFSYRPDLLGTPAYGTSTVSSQKSSSTSVSRRTEDLPFLRQIDVEFEVRRMAPNEDLRSLFFDGIDVTASVTGTKRSNAQGVMTGTFRIPANVRSGTKLVSVLGQGSSQGETSFTGQGTLTIEHYHTTTRTVTTRVTIDPVAQSFVLDTPRQITGARVEFTARGDITKPVILEMRDMEGGLPGRLTYAEGIIGGNFALGDPLVDKPENKTEIKFRFPTLVPENSWRWLALLTDDPNHSVAVAQLGNQSDPNNPRGFDQRLQTWVYGNPALGDLADGSNNVSWRLQPDMDLTHDVMAARYTSLKQTFPIGTFNLSTVNVGGISDVIVLMVMETPSADTRATIEMVRASGDIVRFEPNVPLRLDEYVTETVTLRLVLEGTATLSPIVMPDCQVIWGRLRPTATYISEANDIDLTNGNVKVRTVLETLSPGTSSISVDVGNPGSWTEQTAGANKALGDGWIEREYLQNPYGAATVRTRIRLAGTPKNRPAGRQLRQRATGV